MKLASQFAGNSGELAQVFLNRAATDLHWLSVDPMVTALRELRYSTERTRTFYILYLLDLS